MGRFVHTVSAETKAKSSTIVVNKYEIPENALEIMSKICSPKNEDDMRAYFHDMWDILYPDNGDSFRDFCEKDNDYKFWSFFDKWSDELMIALQSHENTNATQVVVAGAYSSGKSTFLNTILGHKGLLPTGVEPISIVNTFIYCSQSIKDVNVKGVNLKNVLVQLDTDVLQCIQHASNSNVYLASVLEKLIIEYPANELTKGLSFIDTPGYNKSDEKNEVNDKTDKETAMQALEQGDVLFWLVDIQDGTIGATGEEMINHFLEEKEDGKVVIIFNKADKNSAEMRKIVEATARKLNVASQDSRFIDVIAYSSDDPQIYFSYKGLTLERVFEKVRSCSTGYSEVQKIMDRLKSMFDNRIEWHENEKKEWEEALASNKEQKNEWYKDLHDLKEDNKSEIEWYKKIIIDTYNQIYNVADGEGDFKYYDEESRKAALEQIKFVYGCRYDMLKGVYEELCEKIDKKQAAIDKEEAYISLWRDYKDRIVRVLENGIAKANADKKHRKAIIATVKTDRPLDIFQAILNSDYAHFENCFTKSVSLNIFNPEGYSPLTYAVKTGQNDMVHFFIDHNADLKAYDKRGYNAIQTAVENNYKDICQILLKSDPSLATTQSECGEDLMTIARKNTFENWLSKNI